MLMNSITIALRTNFDLTDWAFNKANNIIRIITLTVIKLSGGHFKTIYGWK